MSENSYILQEVRGQVAVLTLNRPETYNAWRDKDRIAFGEILRRCGADDAIAAIVVTGKGDKAFCGGQDLREGQEITKLEHDASIAFWTRFRAFYDVVQGIEKPVITALNGVAAGSGFQFTMLTDMVVGHTKARMGQTEVNSGFGSVTGTYLMCQSLGKSRAMELALSGRLMEGEELYRLGLVHRLVDEKDVLDTAVEIAAEWGAKSRIAVGLTKRAHRQATKEGFDKIWDMAIQYQTEILKNRATSDALDAFFAKRAQR